MRVVVGENSGEAAQFGRALEMVERSSLVGLETKWRWVILSYIFLLQSRRHLPIRVLELKASSILHDRRERAFVCSCRCSRHLCHTLWLSYRERERVAESVARVALITFHTPKW